jgi:hypothetical protein
VPKQIEISGMHKRHRALTTPIAGSYREAATVCLNRYHSSPIEMTLSDNGVESIGKLSWAAPSPRSIDAWANVTDATEAGAYCCAIAGIEALRGLFAVRRAETSTGADYYIGPKDSGRDDLEDCLRLEVSGIGDCTPTDVSRRLLAKVQQARAGDSSLPAVAAVVGFSARLLMVKDVPE